MKILLQKIFSLIFSCLVITTSTIVGVFYINNSYNSTTEFMAIAFILLSLTMSIILKLSLKDALTFIFISAYLTLAITWGHFIPYLGLLAITLLLFIIITGKQKVAKMFACLTVLITVLELFNILPITRPEISIGNVNLLIILTLESFLYSFILLLEPYLFILLNWNLEKGLALKGLTLNALAMFIAKGLYLSVLLHFIKNFINHYTWIGKIDKSSSALFVLFGKTSIKESDRTMDPRQIINSIISYYRNKFRIIFDMNVICRPTVISNIKAQLLLIILFDLLDNILKFSDFNTNPYILIRLLDQKSINISIENNINKISSISFRSLDIMNRLLLITGQGYLKTKSFNNRFYTTLLLNIKD